MKKNNGSEGNGAGHGNEPQEKLIHFPTLAQRDRRRKQQAQLEDWQAGYKKSRSSPFFNFSKIPVFTRLLVLAFIAIHIPVALFLDDLERIQFFYTFGFVPGIFTGTAPGTSPFITVLTPLTHIFLHGSIMHLAVNCMMTLVTGIFFEKEFGTKITAWFFFLSGLGAAALYLALNPFSDVMVIGASGSISGLFGAMIIILFQRRRMHHYGAIPAEKYGPWPLVAFWVLFMAGMGVLGGGSIAWQDHVGGFLTGIGLLVLMQKGKLPFLR